jgi:hypothetical protein
MYEYIKALDLGVAVKLATVKLDILQYVPVNC